MININDENIKKIDFWETDWDKLTESQKNIFCDSIELKSREMEGEFLALITYQEHRKKMGIIKKIV